MNVKEMEQRIAELPAEIQEAKKAARKERAAAIFDGREPDPKILDLPGKLEQEKTVLPDSLFDAKVQSLAKSRDDATAKIDQLQAEKTAASDRMRAAREAKEAADREWRAADKAHSGADRQLFNTQRRVQDAERKLADLQENGFDAGVDSGPSA